MRSPTLAELPPPPAGREGWPWTVETPTPATTPSGGVWPRISVVTPSYQQAIFLEETIRSVLLQGYPDVEYIVMDGGSTDGSVEIIRRYASWLTHWQSGPDGGQSHAINDGFSRASGAWRAWLNSDDLYTPGALFAVARAADKASWLVGHTGYIDEHGRRIGRFPTAYRQRPLTGTNGPAWVDVLCAKATGTALPQQSSFWTADAHDATGGLEQNWEFMFDHDFGVRLSYAGLVPSLLEEELALYRRHDDQKSTSSTRGRASAEEARIAESWLPRVPPEHRSAVRSYRRACARRALAGRARALARRAQDTLTPRAVKITS